MSNIDIRFRQVHLDFHTSEHIEGIGSEFDPEEFASTLEKARVNSVTCFARCHHGWIYFDTKAHPERRHPHLKKNLLKEQIEACRARDIRVPIYITVQWDHYTANAHPEWVAIDEMGCPLGTPPYEAGFYRELCVNSPYVETFLKPHVQEVLEGLPTDGIFFDIVRPLNCSCKYCLAQMEEQDIDPSNAEVRRQFGLETINEFKRKMTRFVRDFNEECTIFYNSGHISSRHRSIVDAYTHFELESLPGGGWGYLHFPSTVRLARNFGVECIGMTGKFHTTWGDFHSFKNEPALQFECFQMLALGAKCSVGDQLHPSGKIDQHVYDLIGSVYSEVEKREPWCREGRPVTEIGVFTVEEDYGTEFGGLPPALMGAMRILEESAHQFDVVDFDSDFSNYSVLVLPDNILVSNELAEKIAAYMAAGGSLIASFESGMDAERHEFELEELGVKLKSNGPRDLNGEMVRGKPFLRADYAEYVLPTGSIGKGLPKTEHVMYVRGIDIETRSSAETLVNKINSYFDRTYKHFCSHQQTPSSSQIAGPAVVKNGKAIYFANPIFSEYNRIAPRWHKQMFLNALDMLLPEPLVQHDGPTTLRVSVNEQQEENRWVLHFLHYIPVRRSQSIDIIEDIISLHNVKVSVKVKGKARVITSVPDQETLSFEQKDGRVEFMLPELVGHQMVALDFGNA